MTGSARGIGAAVAERLGKDGFAVVVNYAGSAADAEAEAAKIKDAGGRAIAVRADVSDPAAVKHLFDEATQAFGGVDVLVNNAGVMLLSTIAEADDALFDRQVAINLKGVFNGMREAAQQRLRAGGRSSASSSVVGLYQPTYGPYAATKGGIEAMTHVLANEMRGKDITVNAIAPRPDRDPSLPRRQAAGRDRPSEPPGAARRAGHARRHRGGRVLPGGARRVVDQRAGVAGQRRHRLKDAPRTGDR